MKSKEDFVAKVKRCDKTGCWLWQGSIHKSTGYARLRWKGVDTHGHRIAHLLFKGPIPKGLQIDHLCRNRKCVNPDHLEAVTMRTNILRGNWGAGLNSRKTHCKHGHEFTAENTYTDKRGMRQCRACMRRRALASYYRAKAKKAARTTKRRSGADPRPAARRE